MKKISILLLLCTAISLASFAQANTLQNCTSTGATSTRGTSITPGITPADGNLPCMVIGQQVHDTLVFVNYTNVTLAGSTVPMNSLTFDSIYLPAGLCWSTNSSTNTFGPGDSALIYITGTPTDSAGQYKLRIIVSTIIDGSISLNDISAEQYMGLAYRVRVRQAACTCPAIDNSTADSAEVYIAYPSCVTPLTVNISANGPTTICSGGSVVLNSSVTPSGSYQYQWYNNGSVIPGATSASYTATTAGSYYLVVTSQGIPYTSNSITVSVLTAAVSLPAYISISAPSFNLVGTPPGGVFSGPGVSGSDFAPSAAGLGSKTITYTYNNGSGCIASAAAGTVVYDTANGTVCSVYDTTYTAISVTDTLIINASLTGISGPDNTNTLTVYPNPAKDHLEINCGNYASMNGYTLKIVNAAAQTVYTAPINQQLLDIDLNTWSGAGTYILYILDTSSNVVATKEIVLL